MSAALYQRSLVAAAVTLLVLLWLHLLPAVLGALIGFVLFGLVWGHQRVRSVAERAIRSVLALALLAGLGLAMASGPSNCCCRPRRTGWHGC